MFIPAPLRMTDVAGMDEVKARYEAAFLAPMRNPCLVQVYRKSLQGGLLLYRPPGRGEGMPAVGGAYRSPTTQAKCCRLDARHGPPRLWRRVGDAGPRQATDARQELVAVQRHRPPCAEETACMGGERLSYA
jgi:hypothetical protein